MPTIKSLVLGTCIIGPALATILVILPQRLAAPLLPEQPSQEQKNVSPGTEKNTLSFMAVGDIMLSRNVAARIARSGDPLLPFQGMGDLLLATDFNFGNLESPYSGKPGYPGTGSLVFNAPPETLKGLLRYNFQVLSLANNHSLDQGEQGLRYTENLLYESGITTLGTGATLAEAWEPAIISHNGIRIAFVAASYASINDNGKTRNEFVARIEDRNQLETAVAKASESADYVVVTMHAGTEYVTKPNEQQTTFAHAAIDAGANIVIGHHPHWVQEVEVYKGRPIFYSLGNFIFDQMWSQETREGLALKLVLEKTIATGDTVLKSLELLPTIIENYSTPRLANEEERERILQALGPAAASL